MGTIYVVTCTVTAKVYVGQTAEKKPQDRWINHLSSVRRGHMRTYFAHAIRKYGETAFVFAVLEECGDDQLNERERFHIARLRSNDKKFGYNMSPGGDGGQNSMTPEVRRKISRALAGIKRGPMSAERRQAISRAKLAAKYHHAPETLAIIRAKRRRYSKLTEEHKRQISIGLRMSRKFRLTPDQIREVIMLLPERSVLSLSKQFGVSRRAIDYVRVYRDNHPGLHPGSIVPGPQSLRLDLPGNVVEG